MVRGRKINDSKVSSDRGISGHLDEWAELAVDYVDGSVDAPTKAAIQTHLDGCPNCAARLSAQQSALALFAQMALADPPAELESQVLEGVLRATGPEPVTRRPRARRTSRRQRSMLSPAGPWLPAMAGAAAVLALVVALTVSRNPAALDETAGTAAATLSAQESSSQTLRDAQAATPSTTDPILLGSGATASAAEDTSATSASAKVLSSTPPQPAGTYVRDRAAMVNDLTQANSPAYFFYDTKDGGLVTAAQASSVASQLTAKTGLRLMDRDLTSGVKAFAAFVPREDSAAVVDLLRSISDSLKLSVYLSLQPGTEVTEWAASMLRDKYSLAELSASPSQPPDTTNWLFTTSTASTTTSDSTESPKATLLDEAGTHVLVVIFMAVGN
jgi:hypothetical protein